MDSAEPVSLGGAGGSAALAGAGPPVLLIGTDHRCSPVELREKVAFAAEEAADTLVHLLARAEIAEASLLSTCNRTEVYVAPRHEEAAFQTVLELVFRARAPEVEAEGRLYVKRHEHAAQHLLAVACGLESMVLGEPEILGQVKQAASIAETVGASGTTLARLLKASLAAGRRARAETAIGAGAVSLGYAVVELARNIFQRLEDRSVLVLGAGEMGRAVARSLAERGAANLAVANRSRPRLDGFLAEFPQARAVPFDDRLAAVAEADLVVVSTRAPEPILTRADLAQAIRRRPGRPLLVVDLGVPRNVDPEARRVENLFLQGLDSLEGLIQLNLRRRREQVPKVQEIVAEELARFLHWHRSLEVEPLIGRLQKQAEAIRRQELAGALPRLPTEYHDEVERLTRSLVRKILHHPSTRLRAADGLERLPRLDLLRELFQLDEEER
jgi:glutamyl-tRNA reductase